MCLYGECRMVSAVFGETRLDNSFAGGDLKFTNAFSRVSQF